MVGKTAAVGQMRESRDRCHFQKRISNESRWRCCDLRLEDKQQRLLKKLGSNLVPITLEYDTKSSGNKYAEPRKSNEIVCCLSLFVSHGIDPASSVVTAYNEMETQALASGSRKGAGICHSYACANFSAVPVRVRCEQIPSPRPGSPAPEHSIEQTAALRSAYRGGCSRQSTQRDCSSLPVLH